MKKVLSGVALALACVMLFAACQKEEQNTPTSTTPPAQQQTTETKPQENKPAEEPKVDPKEEILAKAEEDKEAVLAVMKTVVDNYRSGNVPDYYEAYPSKEAYPKLESVDEIKLEKGDDSCDVLAYVPVGNQNLCIALQYVNGAAEGTSPWMVVAASFVGIKG